MSDFPEQPSAVDRRHIARLTCEQDQQSAKLREIENRLDRLDSQSSPFGWTSVIQTGRRSAINTQEELGRSRESLSNPTSLPQSQLFLFDYAEPPQQFDDEMASYLRSHLAAIGHRRPETASVTTSLLTHYCALKTKSPPAADPAGSDSRSNNSIMPAIVAGGLIGACLVALLIVPLAVRHDLPAVAIICLFLAATSAAVGLYELESRH